MRRNLMTVAIAAVFILGLSTGVVLARGKTADEKPKSLYHRLGGKKGIEKVVKDFIANVGADNRINHYFADTVKDKARLEKFEDNLEDQICQAASGPCKYKGKNMRAAHKGMNITEADFNALVEDLVKALDKNKVGATEKNELLTALGGLKDQIVGQ
jgi:hemoglobin